MEATVKTNGHVRPLQAYVDLPHNVRADFDYIDPDKGEDTGSVYDLRFFEYRGSWYDLNDGFQRICRQSAQLRDPLAYDSFALRVADDSPLIGWDGAQAESAFSAVLVRWAKDWDGQLDTEAVVVGYANW